jgi:hypothetical protein
MEEKVAQKSKRFARGILIGKSLLVGYAVLRADNTVSCYF